VKAQLIESDEEHHWVLLDHRVTQLVIDRESIRIQTWSLDGSADIRLAAPFVSQLPSGATRAIDPRDTERLAPCLALVGLGVRSVTVARQGTLTLAFSDGSVITVAASSRAAAWEVQGGGVLEGMAYASRPGVELW
jgi:hypothetical protein